MLVPGQSQWLREEGTFLLEYRLVTPLWGLLQIMGLTEMRLCSWSFMTWSLYNLMNKGKNLSDDIYAFSDVLLIPCNAVREAKRRIKARGSSLCAYDASICFQRIQKRLLGMIDRGPS